MSKDQVKDTTEEVKKDEKKTEKFYFTSRISGLAFQIKEADYEAGEVAPEVVRFIPYYEKYQGDRIKVGYLCLENPTKKLLKRVREDANTEELDEAEFKKATESKNSQVAGY